ncbi:hypothetical protein ACT048_20570 [Ectopseudomonas khazarica]|uniref:hypothetical protein n=1 Tax=Ectopseudomonas khazarica TaxID=2502979 RepID=UPI00403389C8
MMKRAIAMLVVAGTLAGCNQADVEKAKALEEQVSRLQMEVHALKAQLDEERNGPPRLLAKGQDELAKGELESAKRTLASLVDKRPESSEAAKAKSLIQQIDGKIAAIAEQQRREAERKAAEERAAFAAVDRNLKKKTDEFKGITWVTHKSEPLLEKKMALYFGTKNNSAAGMPLRLKFQYYSDSWLFVRGVTIKADDKVFSLPAVDFERDNSGGSIWEWSDNAVNDFAMLDAVLSAGKVTIRFDGRQYYSDFVLPQTQRVAMKEIMLAWQKYGGKRS